MDTLSLWANWLCDLSEVRWQIWRTLLRQMFVERDWSGKDLWGMLGKVFFIWQAIFTAISSLEWDTERHRADGYTIPLSQLTVWPELLAGLCCGGFLRQLFVSGEVTDLEDFTEANVCWAWLERGGFMRRVRQSLFYMAGYFYSNWLIRMRHRKA